MVRLQTRTRIQGKKKKKEEKNDEVRTVVRLQTRTRIQKLSKFDSAANTRRAGGVIFVFFGRGKKA